MIYEPTMLQIFKTSELNELLRKEYSNVVLVESHPEIVRVSLSGKYNVDSIKSKVAWALRRNLKRFDCCLNGIVIGYKNVVLMVDTNNRCYAGGVRLSSSVMYNIVADYYVFRPEIGEYLKGIIRNKFPNFVDCLVHKFFRVRIPRPDGLDDVSWLCPALEVGRELLFKVTELQFNGPHSRIEGSIDAKDYLHHLQDGDNTDSRSDDTVILSDILSDDKNFLHELTDSEEEDMEYKVEIGVENNQLSDFSQSSSLKNLNGEGTSHGRNERETDEENESRKKRRKTSKTHFARNRDDEEIVVVELFDDDEKENETPSEDDSSDETYRR